MKTKLLLTLILALTQALVSAQGLKLGDNPNTIDSSSLLEMESTSLVFVPTRMTTAQMNAITPLDGALIYNTTEQAIFSYDNGAWSKIGGVSEVDVRSLYIGTGTGAISSGADNVALGFNSFRSNTTGFRNTVSGNQSLNANAIGNNNSAFGYRALLNSNANSNSGFGVNALRDNQSGTSNSAFGVNALLSTNASDNSAFGVNALRANVDGTNNSAFGVGSLQEAIGIRNAAFGTAALRRLVNGNRNVGIGYNSGSLNEDGSSLTDVSNSIFIGNGARSQGNAQNNQIVIGHNAVGNGANSVTIGNDAITDNFFNGNLDITGDYRVNGVPITGGGGGFDPNFGAANVFVGEGAGINTAEDATGRENVAMGAAALGSNVTGIRNTAVGTEALFSNVSSEGNTAVGNSALINTTGGANSGFGYLALSSNIDGTNNSALGVGSLGNLNTGIDNIGVGRNAGSLTADGSPNSIATRSLYLGSSTRANANGQNNQIVIGHGVVGNGSRTVTIGNGSITDVYFGNGYIFSGDDAPASSSAPGETGEIRIDANFIYVCVAPNSWVRAALSSW